jgi:hypothetical protein
VCPACGRLAGGTVVPAAQVTPVGLREIWLRLAVAGGATLLVMSVLLFLLIRAIGLAPRNTPPLALASDPVAAPSERAASIPTPAFPEKEAPPPLLSGLAPEAPAPPAYGSPDTDRPPLPRSLPSKRAQPADAGKPAPADDLAAGWQEGDRFFQELVVGRVSGYHVLDTDLKQDTQYAFVSSFTLGKRAADGSRDVRQRVEAVRLASADPALQARLNTLLQKTRGATFTMTLDPRQGITRFAGDKEALQVFAGTDPLGNQSFLLWSFLDQDGWRELAQLTFFRPERPTPGDGKWSRKVAHSWGPLGSWAGQAEYAAAGRKAGLEYYQYRLDLAYQPPGKGGGDLPFAVGKADFRIQGAGGTIGLDPLRRRVAAAEERFHVRGLLAITSLGVTVPLEMEEVQVFQLRVLDRNPWEIGPAGAPGRGP